MPAVRRAVLDVLKPHEPEKVEMAEEISSVGGVEGVNVSLIEKDEEVENVKLTVEGEFDFGEVRDTVERMGGSVHSVDQVVAGEKTVEQTDTPQDG